MIEILLVDDHQLMVEGTRLIIEQEPDMKVHTEMSSLKALEQIKIQSFNVMLVNLQMSEMDGFELTKKALAIDPNVKILIYSGFEILPHFHSFMESGAVGFVPKTASREQLITAIRCALKQDVVIPITLLKELYQAISPSMCQEAVVKDLTLNEKEKTILKELEKGKTNKVIAQTLYIGQRTLEYNLTNIFNKLGVNSRIEAVLKAKEIGLLSS
ncbi:response regulator transcription factor [Neobacillus muris]|uniref:response regulator transcription factor n=1 Tax=Neobacillus muris TaxID=2941334 RepID=UPI00203CB723|nr:response regulator transcription factor [Neobacillus muris]